MNTKKFTFTAAVQKYHFLIGIPKLLLEMGWNGDCYEHMPLDEEDIIDGCDPDSTMPGYIIEGGPIIKLGNMDWRVISIQEEEDTMSAWNLQLHSVKRDQRSKGYLVQSVRVNLISESWQNASAMSTEQIMKELKKLR